MKTIPKFSLLTQYKNKDFWIVVKFVQLRRTEACFNEIK